MKLIKTVRRSAIPCPLKELCLSIAVALPALAAAQETAGTLPVINVETQAPRETTEGTNSYTSGISRTATPLGLGMRDTPQSVSVVTQQRIEDQALQTITDVMNQTAGVFVHQYETHRGQFTARGFNINTLLIDGVPTSWEQPWSSGEITTSLSIYDRVEVVRGATGLTTGTGDPSAAVNMVRKRADSKEFKGSLELELGTRSKHNATFDLSTPVNEAKTLRVRVVGEDSASDSWVRNLSDKSQTLFATFEADLGPRTLLSGGISRQENNPRGSMWGGLPVWYADGTRTDWDTSKTTAADWTRYTTVYENHFAALEHRFDNDWKVKASYSRGERDADSHLLYLFGAPDRVTGLGLYTFPGSYKVRTVQDDIGLQANGSFNLMGRKHELSFGYVHSKQKFNADSRAAAGGVASDFNNWTGNYPEPTWGELAYYGKGLTTQNAVYGAARFNATDLLKFITGVRVTNYERSSEDIYSAPSAIKVKREVTPYVGAVYDISDSYSVYASYTDIFQPQTARDIHSRQLDPIQGKSFETGIKGELLDGKLNVSGALFHIKQKNLAQATGDTIVGPGGLPETAYQPADGATSKGFELEVSGEVSRGWNVSAGYTQFKLKDAGGADVNSIYPRRVFKLFTTYRLPGDWSALSVGGGLTWQGNTYTLASNPLGMTDRIEQKPYALVNLMARYDISKQLSAQLNINNVFNKTYFAMFDAYAQMTYGAPRNATLTFKYKF